MNERKKRELDKVWSVILPYPIGAEVRYVRKACTCTKCGLKPYLGHKGIVMEYLNNETKEHLRESNYPDLLDEETMYSVKFPSGGTYTISHCELELVRWKGKK